MEINTQVVYASSAAVYGGRYGLHPEPNSHYGASKLACEIGAAAYWHGNGLSSVGIRPFAIYGPGREGDDGYSVGITLACRAAALGEDYTIPFTGIAGFVYVEEVASAFREALLLPPSGPKIYDLPGIQVSVERLVEEIRAAVPDARVRCVGAPLQVAVSIPDGEIYEALPGLKAIGLFAGIRATIAHYRSRSSGK